MIERKKSFMNIMYWLGHFIFFYTKIVFSEVLYIHKQNDITDLPGKALHIPGFLKTVSLEFNSDNFAKAAVTDESASHPELSLRSCPQGEIWTTLTLPKHMHAVSQLSPAPGQGTPLLCCHSPFSCLETLCWPGTPLLGHPSFMNTEDILPYLYSTCIEFASAKNLSQCFRRVKKPFGKTAAS